MKFIQYNISDSIKKSLAEQGFVKPTDIQYRAIPSILKGEDVMAIAQTGTGKTGAFAIPLVHKLLVSHEILERGQVRCLVMVPTRELAVQITGVFEKLATYTPLRIVSTFGGVDQKPQTDQLLRGADVLISTPGRMFDLRSQGFLDLSMVEVLVLDEADLMLAMGFIRDIRDVLRHIPRRHQTLFFSATINEEIKDLAYSIVRNPIRIQISPKDRVSKNVDHQVAFIEMDDKRYFLERMIKQNPDQRFLVFVRTKVRAERVFAAMKRVGIDSLTMHGDKAQEDRLDVMEKFRSSQVRVLIATDVSARGIDIPGVQYVVNYDLPDEAENYVHRVGRTGRGMEKGIAVSFCSPEEKKTLDEIQTFLGKPVQELTIDKELYEMTLAMTEEPNTNWRKLIADAEAEMSKKRKKKGKK
ncbi:MAG TPA: DEAD/DEAH box helicase [Catalimonadaceae bacterium]|nr:DEAD/DEAH box helicase [Catalimonadaceae bacterium]HPI12335.1 DEAD/DEAH box helicase [Catalimonadaceae bacterium]